MTDGQRALAAAWLAEMWAPCREVPRDVRAGERAVAEVRDDQLSEWRGEPELPFRDVA